MMKKTPPLTFDSLTKSSEQRRPSWRRIVGFLMLWIAISAAGLLSPGCYGRNCEGDTLSFGADAGEGQMVDDTHWESNEPNAAWLAFPKQRYYFFDLHALGGRTPTTVQPFVSANPSPNTVGADFTAAGGNIALLFNQLPNRIDVKNDTCSDYFLRLVVTAPPLPPSVDVDGGSQTITNLDAGVADAGDAGDGSIP